MSLSFPIYKMGIIAEAHGCLRIRQDHLFEAFRRMTRVCPVDVSYYFRWEGNLEVSYKLWNTVRFKGIFVINNDGKCRNYGGWMHTLHTLHINFLTFLNLPPLFYILNSLLSPYFFIQLPTLFSLFTVFLSFYLLYFR